MFHQLNFYVKVPFMECLIKDSLQTPPQGLNFEFPVYNLMEQIISCPRNFFFLFAFDLWQ